MDEELKDQLKHSPLQKTEAGEKEKKATEAELKQEQNRKLVKHVARELRGIPLFKINIKYGFGVIDVRGTFGMADTNEKKETGRT